MTEMRDKIAKALFEDWLKTAPGAVAQFETGWDGLAWSEDGSDWRDLWRSRADIVLDALMEPTEAMTAAVSQNCPTCGQGPYGDISREIFVQMVQAAKNSHNA